MQNGDYPVPFLARLTFFRMSVALAVHMNGLDAECESAADRPALGCVAVVAQPSSAKSAFLGIFRLLFSGIVSAFNAGSILQGFGDHSATLRAWTGKSSGPFFRTPISAIPIV